MTASRARGTVFSSSRASPQFILSQYAQSIKLMPKRIGSRLLSDREGSAQPYLQAHQGRALERIWGEEPKILLRSSAHNRALVKADLEPSFDRDVACRDFYAGRDYG